VLGHVKWSVTLVPLAVPVTALVRTMFPWLYSVDVSVPVTSVPVWVSSRSMLASFGVAAVRNPNHSPVALKVFVPPPPPPPAAPFANVAVPDVGDAVVRSEQPLRSSAANAVVRTDLKDK